MQLVGWKAHIRVDEHDINNLRKAWDILQAVVFEHQIWRCKIVTPEAKFYNRLLDYGSQITIYCFFQPELNWQVILTQLTDKLRKAKVAISAQQSPNDQQIQGSEYITYRNDDPRYNPATGHNPFANIIVQLNNVNKSVEEVSSADNKAASAAAPPFSSSGASHISAP